MANNTTLAIAVVVLGGGVAWYVMSKRDKTPVGLVVVNAIEGGSPLGETSDGKTLTAGAVEGTWRADEDSLSVMSESAERPLLVIYEDGTPIHAELITMSEWSEVGEDNLPDECKDDINTQECGDALTVIQNELMKKWRAFAKDAGATEESYQSAFPLEETTVAEAESIFGPMLSLQSHFVW